MRPDLRSAAGHRREVGLGKPPTPIQPLQTLHWQRLWFMRADVARRRGRERKGAQRRECRTCSCDAAWRVRCLSFVLHPSRSRQRTIKIQAQYTAAQWHAMLELFLWKGNASREGERGGRAFVSLGQRNGAIAPPAFSLPPRENYNSRVAPALSYKLLSVRPTL